MGFELLALGKTLDVGRTLREMWSGFRQEQAGEGPRQIAILI
jgi:hypothetical protein